MANKPQFRYLNWICLIGRVGFTKVTDVGDRKHIRMSVVTNYAYKDRDGNAVMDTMWHQVVGWVREGASVPNKGDIVRVSGRLTYRRYCSERGEDRTSAEIIAGEWDVLADASESIENES